MSTNGLIFKPQVFDGEGIDPSDFNALSSQFHARLNDFILGSMASSAEVLGWAGGGTGYGDTSNLYAFNAGAAPRNRATNRSFGCNGGLLVQTPPNGFAWDGLTPSIKTYMVTQNEISGSFATADPTNPRYDAVFVRITDTDGAAVTRDFKDAVGTITSQSFLTTKQSRLEFQIVAGTPAVKPLIPAAPDSSWAIWGAWWIPATFAAPFTISNIYDYRIPFGIKRYIKTPGEFDVGAGWALSFVQAFQTAFTAGNNLRAACPVKTGRIIRTGFTFLNGPQSGGFSTVGIPTASPASAVGEPNNGIPSTDMNNYELRKGLWYSTASGLPNQQSASGYQLLPLWANGYGSEVEDTTPLVRWVASMWTPGTSAGPNDIISCAFFDIAGGG